MQYILVIICRYEESAAMYAMTQNSFEEIALKFIKLPRKDALKMFVQKKLSSLRNQVPLFRYIFLTFNIVNILYCYKTVINFLNLIPSNQ